MLRLPRFEVLEPTTVEEALALLAEYGDRARVMAGGTDLLPNMKHEIETPEVVIGLWRIESLRTIDDSGDAVKLGPGPGRSTAPPGACWSTAAPRRPS